MHQTLSKYFHGRINSIKKEGAHYHIRGWVAPLIESDSCNISCEGFVTISAEERPDIYNLYKQRNINYLRSGFNIILNPLNDETVIMVNGTVVFKINTDSMENILQPNIALDPKILIIDNFYSNPDKVREYALKQQFTEKDEYSKITRSLKCFKPSWMQQTLESLINKSITEFI